MPSASTTPGRMLWMRMSAVSSNSCNSLDSFRSLEVDGDRRLVAVHVEEVQEIALCKGRAHVARVVAQLRLLDLDHVGAKVGEDRRRVGRRQHLADFNHLHAFEHSRPRSGREPPSIVACNHSTIFGTFKAQNARRFLIRCSLPGSHAPCAQELDGAQELRKVKSGRGERLDRFLISN